MFYNNAGVEGDIKPITITRFWIPAGCLTSTWSAPSMKHVLPVMLRNDKGSIINTASIAGLMGSPRIAVYSASKHAVIGLTKSAAWEYTNTQVRINCVCPGLIDSRMLSAIIDGRDSGKSPTCTRPNPPINWRVVARPGLPAPRLDRGRNLLDEQSHALASPAVP